MVWFVVYVVCGVCGLLRLEWGLRSGCVWCGLVRVSRVWVIRCVSFGVVHVCNVWCKGGLLCVCVVGVDMGVVSFGACLVGCGVLCGMVWFLLFGL